MMSLIDKLTTHLSNLSLTITQWLFLTMAIAIGGLVAMLKIQGGQLHKAQLELLEQHIKQIDANDTANVQVARDRYMRAMYLYQSAKKD
jgi:parvulin-like peptidyl-prolyl isomerase